MKKLSFLTLIILVLFSCQNENKKEVKKEEVKQETKANEFAELDKQARTIFGVLDKEAVNPKNPITPEKVALGKKLYFDKLLSLDKVQSCNTCHNVETYGVDNKQFSIGDKGKPGGRNSPTTFNAAFHIAQFWDGREPDVEAQAGGPMLNPVEMAMPNEKEVIKRLSSDKEYKEMFDKAFPNDKQKISFENVKKAIGAFERKLVTPSKFDKYIAGDDNALSPEEKKGLQTFINSGCISCHSGKLLGGNMFQKFGLFGNYWELTQSKKIDNGKFDITKKEEDKYVFKVPSLRNIEKTYPYFHDGSVTNLEDAVKIMAKLQNNKDLTDTQVKEIVTFLKTLTGEKPEVLMN